MKGKENGGLGNQCKDEQKMGRTKARTKVEEKRKGETEKHTQSQYQK